MKKTALFLFIFSFSPLLVFSQFNVDRLGGCRNDGAGNNGTFAYCLANVGVGGTIDFAIGGTFTHVDNNGCGAANSVESHWIVPGGVTIDGNGNNPIIDASLLNDPLNTWKTHNLLLNGPGVTLQNLRVTGAPNNDGNGGTGVIIVNGAGNITISNCEIDNNQGPGIQHDIWAGGAAVVPALATTLVIEDCDIHDNGSLTTGGSGIQLTWFDDVTIEDCIIHDNGDHGIFFEGGYKACVGCVRGVTNATVQRNQCIDNGIFNTTGAGITFEDQSDGNLVDNNTCTGNSEHGIWMRQDCDNNTITNNTCSTNGFLGANFSVGINLALGGCDNNQIRDNICDGNENHGVYIYNTTNSDNTGNIVEQNILTNNGGDGVQIMNCTGNSIRDNYIGTTTGNDDQGNTGNGVYLTNSASANLIHGNTIIFNTRDGIHLDIGTLIPPFSVLIEVPVPAGSCSGNYIYNNKVGINRLNAAAGNLQDGINVTGSDGNFFGEDNGGTVLGNYISNNGVNGISFDDSDNNEVVGNIIGLDTSGVADQGNVFEGISIDGGSQANNIGNIGAGEGNVISGNGQNGISLITLSDANVIRNNYIGLASNGTTIIMNGFHGVDINGAINTVVGGAGNGRNYISGNGDPAGVPTPAPWASGIIVQANSNGTEVYNNYIGLDIAGVAKPNQQYGVTIDNSASCIIGDANLGNVISGHGDAGDVGINVTAGSTLNLIQANFIGTDAAGTGAIPNHTGIQIVGSDQNTIGGNAANLKNVVSGNTGMGINISNSATTVISGNCVGVGSDGTTALANALGGINVSGGSTATMIGGSTVAERNVVANNGIYGVRLTGVATDNNTIAGNYIGLDATGAAAGNATSGIELNGGAANNTIGGLTANERNVISNNGAHGIIIAGATDNLVQSNYIGTDVAGTGAMPNTNHGIEITTGASGNTIGTVGGSGVASGNLISGNTQQGVSLTTAATTDNYIRGNTIGMDVNGTAALPNGIHGVGVTDAINTFIGGDDATERNLISGNLQNGIGGTNATMVVSSGNYIGTDITGTLDFGNGAGGVSFTNGGSHITGGSTADSANVISGNDNAGVFYTNVADSRMEGNIVGLDESGTATLGNLLNGVYMDGGSTNNLFRANIISSNGQNGIYSGNSPNNIYTGNYIGTDITGTLALGNEVNGMFITDGSNNAIIDGLNVISGNGGTANDNATAQADDYGVGVYILNSSGVEIRQNHIGPDVSGNNAIGNKMHGVYADGANNLIIGGDLVDRNVISGNGDFYALNENQFCAGGGGQSKGNGVDLRNSADVTVAGNYIGIGLDNSQMGNQENGMYLFAVNDSRIGGAGDSSNVVSNNIYKGILLLGSSNNSMMGNLIGVDANGVLDHGNGSGKSGPIVWNGCANGFIGGAGIFLLAGAQNNTIGGPGDLRNIISGNSEQGIMMQTTNNGTVINNNYIGTDITGTTAIPNDSSGIKLIDGNSTVSITGNVVSGNGLSGIRLDGTSFGNGSNSAITIESNSIGVASDGSALGNTNQGIRVHSAVQDNIVIGSAGNGNTISSNGVNGVFVDGAHTNVTIASNIVGLDPGLTATRGNTEDGIQLTNAASVSVTNNVLSGNTVNGVDLDGSSTNTFTGNIIGTDVASGTTDFGNGQYGINMTNGSSGNQIDGSVSVNYFAYNQVGNVVDGATSTGNTFTQNSHYCNERVVDTLGIELSNNGNNGFQVEAAFLTQRPLVKLTDAAVGGNASLSMTGLSAADGSIVEVFRKDDECDFCQGKTYVGQTVMAGGDFLYDLGGGLNASDCNQYVVTITDAGGNTSQFSPCSECSCLAPVATFDPVVPNDSIELCLGAGDTLLIADEVIGAEYLWFMDGADQAVDNDSLTVSELLGAREFYFVVRDPGDIACADTSDTVVVVYHALPTPSITPTAAVCAMDQDVVYSTADNPGSTYSWNVASDATGTGSTTASETVDFGTTATINIEVVETDNNGCVDSTDVDITVNPLPTPVIAPTAAVCALTLGEVYSTANNVGSNYSWVITGDATGTSSVTSSETIDFGSTSPVNIKVIETDVNTCVDSVDIDITVNPLPTPAITGNMILCSGATGEVYTSVGPGPVFNWSIAGATGAINGVNTNSTVTVDYGAVVASTNVTLTLYEEDANGCSATTDTVIVVAPPPTPTIAGQDPVCVGDTLGYDAVGSGTFVWKAIGTDIDTIGDGNLDTVAVTFGPGTGAVTLRVIESVGTCVDSFDLAITINPLPTVTFGPLAPVCIDNGVVNLSTAGGPSPAPDGNEFWIINGSLGTASFNPATAGANQAPGHEVIYAYRDPVTGCASGAVANQIVNPLPVVTLDVVPDNFCESATATVLTGGSPSVGGVGVYSGNGISASPTFDPVAAGVATHTITYTFTDGNNCVASATDDIVVQQPDVPTVAIVAPGEVCEGAPLTLNIDQGNTSFSGANPTFEWFVNNGSMQNSASTSYTYIPSIGDAIYVEMTSDASCVSAGPATSAVVNPVVNQYPDPVITGDLVVCSPNSTTLTVTDNNALAPLTYQWQESNGDVSPGGNSSSLTVSSGGSYSVEVTHQGCMTEATAVNVSVIEVDVTASIDEADATIELGEDVVVSANAQNLLGSETNADFDFSWSPGGQTTSSFTDLPLFNTTYTVTATIGACSDVATVDIVVFRPIDPPNVITPPKPGDEGDDHNDYWILRGIETHPGAIIKVFNRWGNVVYHHEGGDTYDSLPFDGTRNGKALPVATYYYVIELNTPNGQEPMSGAVTIIR